MINPVDWKKYPNFSAIEMRCKHTGIDGIRPEFMQRLQRLRDAWGQPMTVSSGYRHPTHPIESIKSKPGTHTTGFACDIQISGPAAYALIELAIEHGFKRIGVNQKGNMSGRFIHLDCCSADDGFAEPAIWSY